MDRNALRNRLLARLADAETVYRTGRSPEELALLADIFAEDLAGEDAETIDRAFLAHRRSCIRFPTVAHIVALLPQCRAPRRDRAALPMQTDRQRTPGLGKLALHALRGDADARKAMAKLLRRTTQAVSA